MIRLLIAAPTEQEAARLAAALEAGGYKIEQRFARDKAEMAASLDTEALDAVVADERWGGPMHELAVRASARRLPAILVAECEAIELIETGFCEVVPRAEPSRLAPALARALRQAQTEQYYGRLLAELRESEARFRAIAENLPGLVFQAVCEPSEAMRLTYVSDGCEALFGLPAAALVADSSLFFELIHPADRDSYLRARRQALLAMRPLNWEGRIRMPGSGETKWVNLRASVRRGTQGNTVMEGIILNVTQRCSAEEALLHSREQLRALSEHLQRAKEEERTHLAREIHDELGSLLTAAKIELAALDRVLAPGEGDLLAQIASVEMLLDQAMEVSRRISRSLRPGVLDYGIVAAIEWQARQFEKHTGIVCRLRCSQDDLKPSSEVSTALFRILQESLTNVVRHSGSREVEVELVGRPGAIILRIADQGCGIRENDLTKSGSFGIRGMQERARALGGTLFVRARVPSGTEVEVVLPLEAPRPSIQAELFPGLAFETRLT